MMLSSQKRQTILAVSLAVITALGLAATVTYAVPSAGSSTSSSTTYLGSIDCTKTNPPMLNLPAGSTLNADGTTMIGGTSYWYVSFIQGNLTTVDFHGVLFTFNGFVWGNASLGAQFNIKGTDLTTKTSPNGLYCGTTLPQITITFPDGTVAVYNKETVTLTAVGANITFDTPSSNPWFTQHTSPQAGIGYQTDGGEITLYVSTT